MASQANGSSKPGAGWSNGDMPPSMFPVTRDGKLSLYSGHRRWIGVSSGAGWTRIGEGATELDARHGASQSVGAVKIACEEEEGRSVRSLIAQLCERFYKEGWATGTGGGVSIRVGGPSENRPWRVFVAPSGIQKEDMIGEDIFELDMDRKVIVAPTTPNLRQSACTPLWYVVYRNRPTARAVIHTHSISAQMATLLDPTERATTLKITHLEMLKGVGNHSFDDVLEIPIIDNRPSEDLLAEQLESVIKKYPKCNAVLVRRHGLYAWGDSWEQAKTQCESFDYLFKSAIQMRSMGIDPGRIPSQGTYRVENGGSSSEPAAKKAKTSENGFRGKAATTNDADLTTNTIPLLPKDKKIVLLDIEGCTTSIAFVKEVLFPYVLEHLVDFVNNKMNDDQVRAALKALIDDRNALPAGHQAKHVLEDEDPKKHLINHVTTFMGHDVKATGLKDLQGKMWKDGYASGQLKGHVYDDLVHTFQWCKAQGVDVYIYSSGSIGAQKLLFGKSEAGDLLSNIKGHFDTTSGGKKEAKSYQTIADAMKVSPSDIVFVSDLEDELVAARSAGIGAAVMSIRPGNAPITNVGRGFPAVHSLLQLCGK